MKLPLRFVAVIFLIGCSCACSKNEKARDGFLRGIYEGSNQVQEMRHAGEPPQPGNETQAYDQYKRERQEILTDQESPQIQQEETTQ